MNEIGPNSSKRPDIIIVTLDSVNADALDSMKDQMHPFLKEMFGENSFSPKLAVTPVAQTHASLSALFTGKPPYESGVRSNLSHLMLDSQTLLKNSPLEKLAEAQYQIRLIQDIEEYSRFSIRPGFFQVDSPQSHVHNIVTSTFSRFRLPFLIPLEITHVILPEAIDNSSFPYGHSLSRFVSKSKQQLKNTRANGGPRLLFFHTCGSHWPGILPYPYYSTHEEQNLVGNRFSYSPKFYSDRSIAKLEDGNARIRQNRQIYQAGIRYLISEYLNPLFAELEMYIQGRPAVIILMSDHGESLWKPNSVYPTSKSPTHGASLVLSSDSEKFLFRGYPKSFFDGLPTELQPEQILSHVQKRISDDRSENLSPASKTLYSETGLWPFGTLPSQFSPSSVFELAPVFSFDRATSSIFVNPFHLPTLIIQKQRAAYRGGYRLTWYPTVAGMREFLCDWENDPGCEKNLILSEPGREQVKGVSAETLQLMRIKLRSSFELDRKNGILISTQCRDLLPSEIENEQFRWQHLFLSLRCLYEDMDLNTSYKNLDLLIKPGSPDPVSDKAFDGLLYICSQKNLFGMKLRLQNFEKDLAYRIGIPVTDKTRVSVGAQDAHEKCADLLGLDPSLRAPSVLNGRLTEIQQVFADEEAKYVQFTKLFNSYIESPSPKVNFELINLSSELLAVPRFRSRIEYTRRIIRSFDRGVSYSSLQKDLAKRFSSEIQYGIDLSLEFYYRLLKLKAISDSDPNTECSFMVDALYSKTCGWNCLLETADYLSAKGILGKSELQDVLTASTTRSQSLRVVPRDRLSLILAERYKKSPLAVCPKKNAFEVRPENNSLVVTDF